MMEASLPINTTLPILKNSVELMTQDELRVVIPQILRLESGHIPLVYSPHQKPAWWPGNIPFSCVKTLKDTCKFKSSGKYSWTHELRNIVRNCYRFYGQEHLLKGDEAPGDDSSSIKVVNNQDGSVSFITDQTVVTLEDRQNTQYASCPSKNAATPGRSLSACTGLQPMPTGLFKSNSNSQKTSITETQEKPFVEVFMCFYCEQQFHHREVLKHHQKFDCALRPTESGQQSVYKTRQYTQLSAQSTHHRRIPEVVKIVPRKPLKLIEEKVVFPDKGVYIESLDLLQHAKAERVRRQSLGKKVDCNVIEVEGSRPPKTPTTPRTPKSLISQLSRDASPPGRARLLSRDGSPLARTKLRLVEDTECKEDCDIKEDPSDDESECSKSENGEDKYRPRRVATLLNIDLSSLLGSRVSKHISEYYDNNNDSDSSDNDDDNSPINTYENYCRTPTKCNDTGRLRSRGSEFQVTFKKTKRTAPKHAHYYKFRRSELSEFCRIVETGLNRRSRALKRQTRKCQVVLSKLTQSQIAKWCRPLNKGTLSPQKQTEIEQWMSGCGSSFDQFDYLRSILLQDGQQQADYRSREHYLFKTMQQSNVSAAGVSSSAAELTPPTTPEGPTSTGLDEDVILLDDISLGQTRSNYTPLKKNPRKTPLTPRQWVDDGDTRFDDVISISSTESDGDFKVISPESLKRAANFSPASGELPVKQRRIEALRPASLLFRCHLCLKEITCHDGANMYIKQHFGTSHNVYNIDLIEHLDVNGQKVVSIVEVPIQHNQPSTPVANKNVSPVKSFYSKTKMIANKISAGSKSVVAKSAAAKTTVSKPAKASSQMVKTTAAKAKQATPATKKVTSTKVNKPQPKSKVPSKNVNTKVKGTKKISALLKGKSSIKATNKKTKTETKKSQIKSSTSGNHGNKNAQVKLNGKKSGASRPAGKSKVSNNASTPSYKAKGGLKVRIKLKLTGK